MEKKWLEMIREVICSNSSCKGETCEHCFCDDDLDKEEIERVFNLIIQSEKQKIIERLEKEIIKNVTENNIMRETYNCALNDAIKLIRGE